MNDRRFRWIESGSNAGVVFATLIDTLLEREDNPHGLDAEILAPLRESALTHLREAVEDFYRLPEYSHLANAEKYAVAS